MDIKNINFFFSENPNPMWIYDPSDLSIKRANDSACDLYGYTEEELLSMTIEELRPESEQAKLRQYLSEPAKEFNNAGIWKHRKKNGDIIFVRVLSTPISHEENTYKLVTVQDVTNEMHYQQEQHMLFENSLDGIMLTSPDGSVHRANGAACNILGMTEEEIIRLGRKGLVEKDKKLQKAIKRRDKTGKFSGELTFIHKSGCKIPVELTTSVYTNPQGEPRTSLVFRDITERKKNEQKLRDILERYHYVTKATNDAIYDWDITEDQLHLEEGFNLIFGHDIDLNSITLEEYTNFVHPDDHPEAQQDLNTALADPSQHQWKHGYRFKKSDGDYAHVIENGYIIRNDDGAAVRMIGAIRDITKQRSLEELLEVAQELAWIGAWQADLVNDEIYWSPITKQIHEVAPDFSPDLETAINFYKEGESRDTIKQVIQEAIENGKSWDVELQLVTAKGNEKWVRAIGKPEIADGTCTRIYGSFQNIHDRKEAEQSLREVHRRNRLILASTEEGIYGIDTEGRCTFINKAAAKMLGYEPEQCIGKNMHKLIHHSFADGSRYPETECPIFVAKNNREGCRVTDEVFWRADGACFEVEYTSNAMIEEGEIKGAVVVFTDTTERNREQKQIRLAKERYDIVAKATSDTIWDLDLENDTIEYNSNIQRMFGYEMQQVQNVADWWREKIHPNDRPVVLDKIDRALETGTHRFQIEYRFQAADGSYKYIYDRAFIVTDDNDKALRLTGAMQDVTDRKKAELELIESNKEKETILESIGDGFFTVNTDWIVTYWNSAAERMLETPKEAVLGKNLWEVFDDAVDLPSYENYHRVMEEGISINFEDYYPPLQRWYNVSAYPSSEGITVYVQEITEQKKKETQLRESLAEKETLLQEIHHRVKNNLAVVSGMMQLQAFEEEDENLKQKLKDSMGRIKTMGSIHELLYQSESFSRLKADKNIKKLVTEIVQTFQTNIELDLHFDLQKISLNINQAIPFSLIIHEVVTNVLKHAFEEQQQGRLSVILKEQENIIRFLIIDNGKGLPPDFTKFEPNNSLGMQLIETLSTQLAADYSYRTVEGKTQFTLTFEKTDVKGTGNSLLS